MDLITEWRIHIGAHKTATTHLQDLLALQRDDLAAEGVDFIPRPILRAILLPPHVGRHAWRLRVGGGWPLRRAFERRLRPVRLGPGRVVMSEERFLGNATALLERGFYPQARERLLPFSALAYGAKLFVFLSIRSPDRLLPSAYAQILRTRPWPGGFGPIRERAVADRPRWSDVVARIRLTLPRASVSIWTMEDYIEAPSLVASSFCGVTIKRSTELPPPSGTRSPSAHAIETIERLDPNLPSGEYVERVKAIIAEDDSTEPFRPFSEREAAALRRTYEDDLETIETSRIRPDPT